jgi:hypothetical protein
VLAGVGLDLSVDRDPPEAREPGLLTQPEARQEEALEGRGVPTPDSAIVLWSGWAWPARNMKLMSAPSLPPASW